MGLNRLLAFTKTLRNGAKVSDVKVDSGGGPNVTAEHFSSPGDDSQPLTSDYVITVPTQKSGGMAAVGYLDPKSDQKANAGDKRIYSRNATGVAMVELWLKNDGSAVLTNALGSIQLLANGSIDLNGVVIDPSGSISTSGTMAAAGVTDTATNVTLNSHTHTQPNDGGGNTESPTAAPTPGT